MINHFKKIILIYHKNEQKRLNYDEKNKEILHVMQSIKSMKELSYQ